MLGQNMGDSTLHISQDFYDAVEQQRLHEQVNP